VQNEGIRVLLGVVYSWHNRKGMSHSATISDRFSLAAGMLLFTDPAATAVYASESVEKTTGFSLPEVIGKNPAALWGKCMEDGFYADMWNTIAHDQAPFAATMKNRRKNGSSYIQRSLLAPIKNKQGNVQYYMAITPQLHNAEHLEKVQAQFEAFVRKPHMRAHAAIAQLADWMGIDGHDAMLKEENTKASLAKHISSFFVLPMQERFSYRSIDKVLIEAAKAESADFAALYAKYFEQIRAYFISRVSNSSIAEDLAQDVFYKAFKYLDSFVPTNSSYGTYLLRIAHNILVNYYRDAQKHIYQPIERAAEVSDNGKLAQVIMRKDILMRVLLRASESERAVIKMKYIEGLSIKEIAALQGKTENAVKLHLSRARKKLRLILKDQ
jgi:RNA polymerase sigma-70 factor, ECF subfamily